METFAGVLIMWSKIKFYSHMNIGTKKKYRLFRGLAD